MQELRPKLADIPGLKVFLQNLPSIRIGGMITKSQYQFTLQSADLDELYQLGADRRGASAQPARLPGRHQRPADHEPAGRRRDRPRQGRGARRLDPEQIENALYNAFGSRQVSTIYTPTNEYWVILEVEPQYQRDPSALSMLYVRGGGGALVPLGAVAPHRHLGVGPLSINHLGQLPAVTISFNLAPGRGAGRGRRTGSRTPWRSCARPPR